MAMVELVKCMVLNSTHVGKRLQVSNLYYPPGYQVPLER